MIRNVYQTTRRHLKTTEEDTEPSLKASVFWNVTPCSLAGIHKMFKWNYRLHFRGTKQYIHPKFP